MQIKTLRTVINRLPLFNYNLLRRLMEHLSLVAQHGEFNKMHSVNLAIVFSMSFLLSDDDSLSMASDLGAMQTLLKIMIANPDKIFISNGSNEDKNDKNAVSRENGQDLEEVLAKPDIDATKSAVETYNGLMPIDISNSIPEELAEHSIEESRREIFSNPTEHASAMERSPDLTRENSHRDSFDSLMFTASRMELTNAATIAAAEECNQGLQLGSSGRMTIRANKRVSTLILMNPSPPLATSGSKSGSSGSNRDSYSHEQENDSKRSSMPEVQVF